MVPTGLISAGFDRNVYAVPETGLVVDREGTKGRSFFCGPVACAQSEEKEMAMFGRGSDRPRIVQLCCASCSGGMLLQYTWDGKLQSEWISV